MTNIDVVSTELKAEIYYYRNFAGKSIKTRVMDTVYSLDTDYLIVPIHSYKFLSNTSRFKDRLFVIKINYDVIDKTYFQNSIEKNNSEKKSPTPSKGQSPSKNKISINITEDNKKEENIATSSEIEAINSLLPNDMYIDDLGRVIKKKNVEYYFKIVSDEEYIAYVELQNEKDMIANSIRNKK